MSEFTSQLAHPVNELGEIEDALDVMANALNQAQDRDNELNQNGVACILRLLGQKVNYLSLRLDEGCGYSIIEVAPAPGQDAPAPAPEGSPVADAA